MSHEKLDHAASSTADEDADELAPTQRDPSVARLTPPRGVALSVLWWLEGDPPDAGDPS